MRIKTALLKVNLGEFTKIKQLPKIKKVYSDEELKLMRDSGESIRDLDITNMIRKRINYEEYDMLNIT